MAEYKVGLLLGGPGTGKGTQGKILGGIPGFYHFSTGDMFRALDKHSELGRTFTQYSERGELVPDELTVRIWAEHMAELVKQQRYNPDQQMLLLDGLPRTVEQAKLIESHVKVFKIVYLGCKDKEAMYDRLSKRAMKEGRKDDADPNVIRRRWEVYEAETAPVLGAYSNEIIAQIDAVGSIGRVLKDILAELVPIYDKNFT